MSTAAPPAARSPRLTTERARAFVASRRPAAAALGAHLADLVHDPEAFVRELRRGLAALADPDYRAAQASIAPGIVAPFGVRRPLLGTVLGRFRRATRAVRPSALLWLADRLLREPEHELRIVAIELLERVVPDDPERGWQLLRRAAREASDWITVDTLADRYAEGVLREPYRWAELEQLVYSPSRWERRLVGSAIARLPHVGRVDGRRPEVAKRGLEIVGTLLGDPEPDVQKALGWALRELALADPPAVGTFVAAEAERAASTRDGHRARVLRDALGRLDRATAERVRRRLAGIRVTPRAPGTSIAAATAARFGRLPDPRAHPEPPLS